MTAFTFQQALWVSLGKNLFSDWLFLRTYLHSSFFWELRSGPFWASTTHVLIHIHGLIGHLQIDKHQILFCKVKSLETSSNRNCSLRPSPRFARTGQGTPGSIGDQIVHFHVHSLICHLQEIDQHQILFCKVKNYGNPFFSITQDFLQKIAKRNTELWKSSLEPCSS